MSNSQRSIDLDLGRRPLAFVSVHATGFDPNVDRIVEVAVVKKHSYRPTRTYHQLVWPVVPILPQATEFHGVTDATVAAAKSFDKIAPGLLRFFGAADLAGFGIRRLALPLLVAEFGRLGIYFPRPWRSVVDLEDIYLHHHPRDLGAAVGCYLGRELSPHAGGLAEAQASREILDAQLQQHQELPIYVPELGAYPFSRTETGLFRRELGLRPTTFIHGRHRGRTPEEVARLDPSYLRSLLGPGRQFSEDSIIKAALAKVVAPED